MQNIFEVCIYSAQYVSTVSSATKSRFTHAFVWLRPAAPRLVFNPFLTAYDRLCSNAAGHKQVVVQSETSRAVWRRPEGLKLNCVFPSQLGSLQVQAKLQARACCPKLRLHRTSVHTWHEQRKASVHSHSFCDAHTSSETAWTHLRVGWRRLVEVVVDVGVHGGEVGVTQNLPFLVVADVDGPLYTLRISRGSCHRKIRTTNCRVEWASRRIHAFVGCKSAFITEMSSIDRAGF